MHGAMMGRYNNMIHLQEGCESYNGGALEREGEIGTSLYTARSAYKVISRKRALIKDDKTHDFLGQVGLAYISYYQGQY